MNLATAAYQHCSCPYSDAFGGAFPELLVVEEARFSIRTAIDNYLCKMNRDAPGLVDVLDNWLSSDITFEAVWCMALGELTSSLRSCDVDGVRHSAAGVALRSHQFALEGAWNIQFRSPAILHFDRWVLREVETIDVVAEARQLQVEVCTAGRRYSYDFHVQEGAWNSSNLKGLPVLKGDGFSWGIYSPNSLTPPSRQLLLDGIESGSAEQCRDDLEHNCITQMCESALKLIGEFARPYLPWVHRVIRGILPISSKTGIINSSSSSSVPGIIAVPELQDECILAEALVHEATHQYLYILKRLGPLEDGTDKRLYFSPFRNVGRPIVYILFAYHAFGNVLLFYKVAASNGLTRATTFDIEQRMTQLSEQLEVLEGALHESTALTQLGKSLWEPLYERIHRA